MAKQIKVTAQQVVSEAFAAGDTRAKIAGTMRAYLSGFPVAERETKVKELYTLVRTIDGVLTKARDLPERERRAYGALRQAFSDAYPKTKGTKEATSAKGGEKGADTGTKTGAEHIALDPKAFKAFLTDSIAAIQGAEKPVYKDVATVIAAMQVLVSKLI